MGSRFCACICIAVAVASAAPAAQAPRRALTSALIYDPATRINFSGTPATDIRWVDGGSYLLVKRAAQAGGGFEWLKVDAASGRTSPFFDQSRMQAVLAALPGVTSEEASTIARSNDLTLNDARTAALFTIDDDLYSYDFGSQRASRLTTAAGVEEEATFSPDGRRVAFVRANNLFVVDVAAPRERPMTTDGSH